MSVPARVKIKFCDPKLIYRIRLNVARQVRIDGQVVLRVRSEHENTSPQTEKIIFAHHSQDPFVVHFKAAVLQFGRDSSITVSGPFERGFLHLVTQIPFQPALSAEVSGSGNIRPG